MSLKSTATKCVITQSETEKTPRGRVESLKSMGIHHAQPVKDNKETFLCPFRVTTVFLLASSSKTLTYFH